MILYGNSLSPFARKAIVFAGEKGVALDVKPVPPGSEDPQFRAASPFGKIPALCDEDFLLCDSSAIVHYIEAKHPEPALIPQAPKARARAVWFDEFADTILAVPIGKIYFNRIIAKLAGRPSDLAVADAAQEKELPPVLAWLEAQIPPSNFLVGGALSLADISVGSMLVNLVHARAQPDSATYPKLSHYSDALLSRPVFGAILAREQRILG